MDCGPLLGGAPSPGLQTPVNTLNETMIGRPDIIFWIEIHEFILVNDGIFKHEGLNQNISGMARC